MTAIRPCRPDDLAAVSRLFVAVFRPRGRPEAVASYFQSLLFADPERDPEIASKVAVSDEGRILGFIGVLPGRMTFAGRTLRVASAMSLMIDPASPDSMAGARLVRAYLAGPQDLSLTESANRTSREMLRALGATALPSYSMDWFLPLQPIGFAVALAEQKKRAAGLALPLARLADSLLLRWRDKKPVPPPQGAVGTEIAATPELLAQVLPALTADLSVVPDFAPQTLAFRIAHAAAKQGWGPFHARLVMRGDQPLGCYMCYAPRGRIARVLQMVSLRTHAETVLAAVVEHAHSQGCVGVRGRAEPAQSDAVLARGALLALRGVTLVKTADPKLFAAIRGGEAWLTGLACESWTRLIGDPLNEPAEGTDSRLLKRIP